VIEDAVHHLGPDFIRQASFYNIERFFGWVSNVNDFCGTILQAAPTKPERD
jgi:ureidoacrylate peracid hydrolase